MHDALICDRRFRTFNVMDEFNCEALLIEIDLNLPAQRFVRILDRIVENWGYSVMHLMDNGPEYISLTLAEQLINQTCDNTLPLLDKGYYSLGLLNAWNQTGKHHHWMSPLKKGAKYEKIQKLGKGDHLVRLKQARRRGKSGRS